jgi:hypothetical protein
LNVVSGKTPRTEKPLSPDKDHTFKEEN